MHIERGSKWKPHYEILDEGRIPVLKIQGNCCIVDGPCAPCDNQFKVRNFKTFILCK